MEFLVQIALKVMGEEGVVNICNIFIAVMQNFASFWRFEKKKYCIQTNGQTDGLAVAQRCAHKAAYGDALTHLKMCRSTS